MNRIMFFLRLHHRALLITLITTVSIAAIVVYATVYRDTPATPAAPAPTATAAPAPTEPHYPGRVGEDTHDGPRIYTPGPSAGTDPDALVIARDFATAWARPSLSTEEWIAGVDDYATNDYIRPLRNIDPGNVPASKVTGNPTAVTSRTDQVIVDVPTDGGVLRLTVVSLVGEWWVSYTEFVAEAHA